MAEGITISAGTNEQVALELWKVMRMLAKLSSEGDKRVADELALYSQCLDATKWRAANQ